MKIERTLTARFEVNEVGTRVLWDMDVDIVLDWFVPSNYDEPAPKPTLESATFYLCDLRAEDGTVSDVQYTLDEFCATHGHNVSAVRERLVEDTLDLLQAEDQRRHDSQWD